MFLRRINNALMNCGENMLISPSNMEKIETYDCVIISDYDKGFLPKKMIEKI